MILCLEPTGENPLLLLFFLSAASVAMGTNLVVLLISTLVSMFAPGKALRGEGHEPVQNTIDVMEDMYKQTKLWFIIGAVAYFITSGLAVFYVFEFVGACIVCGLLFVFLIIFLVEYHNMRKAFVLRSKDLKRGNLQTLPVQLRAESGIGRLTAVEYGDTRISGSKFTTSFASRI
uniref:Uncharacterized protein n=1 Tax=Chromera velia CCMP2878 TaxID=1169474 RepID=A0A0G4IBA4_9ALVE|eukprot:Cvel_12805.t1-p1 / transcript=Cvel_12805.t1 / gene=Cvel_12805 / organism=Chromera_velia_CCMP2878 / gene_product=hypothetical protein / transcript_product=hypothetical protein / location=Cvel_scaffold853:21088-21609(+) / protein_length=174 / sequence_SO=supercontig / SO=protein_coding / is_pseudo=false